MQVLILKAAQLNFNVAGLSFFIMFKALKMPAALPNFTFRGLQALKIASGKILYHLPKIKAIPKTASPSQQISSSAHLAPECFPAYFPATK